MNNLNFIILAAGKGTRMKNNLPKVLHKICDKPLISYILSLTDKFDNKRVTAITSPEVKQVESFIKKHNIDIKIIHQNERLGTGHAVLLASKEIEKQGYSIILYGDTPFISAETINKMLKKLQENTNSAICVLGFETTNPTGYGRLIVNEANQLSQIVEEKEASETQKKVRLCNSGVMIFDNKHLHELISEIKNNNSKQEYYLTDAIEIASNKGLNTEYVVAGENEVMGVNSQVERADAEKMRQNYLRQKHLENGVILIAPDTNFFSEETQISSGVVIHPYSIFKGKNNIAENVEIFAFSHLEESVIKEGVNIGPYARIRPGAYLESGSRIGNFVEIKKSTIGQNSKINHLSYIGDAEIGENVNIGAGTITCNYDGENKYQTIIENNVFVGSNSSLVAPVKLGENSIIGAGTTLFKDAPNNKITINQMPLTSKEK